MIDLTTREQRMDLDEPMTGEDMVVYSAQLGAIYLIGVGVYSLLFQVDWQTTALAVIIGWTIWMTFAVIISFLHGE